MVTGTEQVATQKLEEAIKAPSTEPEEVSEEETTEDVEGEAPAETPEVETEEAKALKEKEEALTPENYEAKVQAAVDKQTNTYREKREADTALIRSQATEIRNLKSEKGLTRISKAMGAILEGDEEEGVEPDKIEARKKAFDEIKGAIKDYNEKVAEVEEAASLSSALAEKIDKGVSKHYGLFDSNPSVRAKGTAELVVDATYWIQEKEAFLKILEEIPLLQKGEEVRRQIDGFVNSYMELSDKKGKDLLIKQIKQELRVTPRKKPPAPSDASGGEDVSKLSHEERIERALIKMDKK